MTILPTDEEQRILDLLQRNSYADIERKTGWKKGNIWRLAVKHGARKTEIRIHERNHERLARQRATLEEILNETVTCDVLDGLEGLPDDTAQAFVTSIPYNVGKHYGGAPSADRMRHLYYHGWLLCIISEMARILRPGGVVFLQVGLTKDDDGERLPIDILLFEALKRAGLTYQNRVVWKSHHGLTPRRRLAERYETALIFSKGEPTFCPGSARRPAFNPKKRAFKGRNVGKLSGTATGTWPTDVWDDPAVRHIGANNREMVAEHPAQFPIGLARRAILLYSLPDDLIIDPVNGSGTTQIACRMTGRRFVGFDLAYEDVRARRLASVVPDTVSPLTGVTTESMAIWAAEARRVDVHPDPAIVQEEKNADQLALQFPPRRRHRTHAA